MIKVSICDDHKIVREGLKQILEEYSHIQVLYDVSSGEELYKKFKGEVPDVLILDISLPGRSGLEILKQLKISHPQMHVLILSMYPEDQFAIRVLKAGASGYLHKDSSPEKLIEAIDTIAQGNKYLNPSVSSLLLKEISAGKKQNLHELLSDREYEVMIWIGRGKSLTEIGEIMSISIKTVSTYRTRILQKMNMQSNVQLIKYLIDNNLLPVITGD